jgi:hypothetical protein
LTDRAAATYAVGFVPPGLPIAGPPQPKVTMRTCPSAEGSASPLITHRIGVDVCLARQDAQFHKCHRCIYRGKAASWEPAESQLPMLSMPIGTADVLEPKKPVVLPSAKPAAKPGKSGKPGKKAPVPAPAVSRSASARA